jgi:SHS2 domain-containing protein
VPFKIEITKFNRRNNASNLEPGIDTGDISDGSNDIIEIEAIGFGETFDLEKHPQGTEVKAITYSAMQINENPNFAEVFVIIDI